MCLGKSHNAAPQNRYHVINRRVAFAICHLAFAIRPALVIDDKNGL